MIEKRPSRLTDEQRRLISQAQKEHADSNRARMRRGRARYANGVELSSKHDELKSRVLLMLNTYGPLAPQGLSWKALALLSGGLPGSIRRSLPKWCGMGYLSRQAIRVNRDVCRGTYSKQPIFVYRMTERGGRFLRKHLYNDNVRADYIDRCFTFQDGHGVNGYDIVRADKAGEFNIIAKLMLDVWGKNPERRLFHVEKAPDHVHIREIE